VSPTLRRGSHRIWLEAGTFARGTSTQETRAQATGAPFLGFNVYPQRRRLKARKAVHFRRKFRAMQAAYGAGELTLDQLTASAQGRANHARYGNTTGLRTAVLGTPTPRRPMDSRS
jgi:hypothetical protein